MLAPSKMISIEDSTLNKASKLGQKIEEDISLTDLYKATKKEFYDLSEFMDALDLLFILGKINLDKDQGVVKIA
nr:ABC-three component system middle component 7 [uncultured Halomonas sp.]